MKRQIFAIAGGGFRMRKIHRSITAKRNGEYFLYPDSEPGYIEKFYKAFPHAHNNWANATAGHGKVFATAESTKNMVAYHFYKERFARITTIGSKKQV